MTLESATFSILLVTTFVGKEGSRQEHGHDLALREAGGKSLLLQQHGPAHADRPVVSFLGRLGDAWRHISTLPTPSPSMSQQRDMPMLGGVSRLDLRGLQTQAGKVNRTPVNDTPTPAPARPTRRRAALIYTFIPASL
jgi:hypothetical protein